MNSPLALLSLIVALPLFGVLFALTSKDDADKPGRNAFNVCVFTLLANIVLIWRIFMILDEERGLHEGIGRFISWLQTHTRVNNKRPTNAYICEQAEMSSGTFSKVKKGF